MDLKGKCRKKLCTLFVVFPKLTSIYGFFQITYLFNETTYLYIAALSMRCREFCCRVTSELGNATSKIFYKVSRKSVIMNFLKQDQNLPRKSKMQTF